VHAYANGFCQCNSNCDIHAYSYAYGNTQCYTNHHRYSYCDSNCYCGLDCHGYSHSYSYNHSQCYANGHSNGYAEADAQCTSTRNAEVAAHASAAALSPGNNRRPKRKTRDFDFPKHIDLEF
jgi:hypothetical protein